MQREFWTARYQEDPTFFGDRESDFARWAASVLRREGTVHEVLELGCGYGRDTKFLSAQGWHVRGVDLAVTNASGPPTTAASGGGYELIEADALGFLRKCSPRSLDAVYSNMLLNMEFTETEHAEILRAVHRSLRKEGLHLYSARSTSDPWYGRGKKVGPDTFDPAPHGVTMHFFSREYADRIGGDLFTPVERREVAEGEDEFPIRLLYVVDRRT